MADFALNDDQLQLQQWVHDFAVNQIRPVAHEWDEREEFPWPVVQEAAKIGLYGWEFLMNAFADSTALTLPVVVEELFWGDAGIGMAIMGSALAAAGISGNETTVSTNDFPGQSHRASSQAVPSPNGRIKATLKAETQAVNQTICHSSTLISRDQSRIRNP